MCGNTRRRRRRRSCARVLLHGQEGKHSSVAITNKQHYNNPNTSDLVVLFFLFSCRIQLDLGHALQCRKSGPNAKGRPQVAPHPLSRPANGSEYGAGRRVAPALIPSQQSLNSNVEGVGSGSASMGDANSADVFFGSFAMPLRALAVGPTRGTNHLVCCVPASKEAQASSQSPVHPSSLIVVVLVR